MDAIIEISDRLTSPSSRALAHAVSRAIRDGVLPPGTKLPPIRTVARELALSPTTVSAGWALLIRSGTIRTDGRRGTIVADTAVPVAAARYRSALERQEPFAVDLATGVPDPDLLPSLRRTVRTVTTAATVSSYLDATVLPELSETLQDDWPYRADEIAIVDGAMDALDLIVRSCFTIGDRVVVESPSFPPIVDLLESVGLDIVGVPVDDEGISLAPLRSAVSSGAAAVIIQPRAQNPTGISMSATRLNDIATLVRGTNTLVIEDDSSAAIAPGPAISAGMRAAQRTVHIRSFSKSYGPDLRLAAVSGPPQILDAIAARRQLGQGWSSRLLQRVLHHLLTDETSIRQVEQARTEYSRRVTALADALDRQEVHVIGRDGINLWVPVHDEAAAIVRLATQGIGVAPGQPFATVSGQAPHIRVTAGRVAKHHGQLAAAIAAAARTQHWGRGVR